MAVAANLPDMDVCPMHTTMLGSAPPSLRFSEAWNNPPHTVPTRVPNHFGPRRSISICLSVSLIICFPCAAFSSYGAFWLSFATVLIPDSGIAAAYTADPGMENDALGIYLLAWMIVTFLFL